MEKAITRLNHNTSTSLPFVTHTASSLLTSTLTFPTHHPLRTSPLSANCSLPPHGHPTIPTHGVSHSCGTADVLPHKLANFVCKRKLRVKLSRIKINVMGASVTKVAAADDSSLAVKKKAADVSPELKGTSIFLVGLGSSLKTSLGKLLADVLRYYYFDSNSLVEEAIGGASAAKLFRESDEKGFCESETEVLKQLSSMGRLVVCAGNGAVHSATNLSLLRHGISLLVDVPLDIVARDVIEAQGQFASFEISTSGSYPEVMNQLAALYNKHRDGYDTADAVISLQKVASRLGYDNLDDITKEDMALEALGEIEKLTRVKKMMAEAARPF